MSKNPIELKEIFNKWARSASKRYARKQWLLSKWELFEGIEWPEEKSRVMFESLRKGLKLTRRQSLVDLGCGGGWIAHALKPSVKSVLGLDFSHGMLSFAKSAHKKDRYLCGEIGRLPFAAESFDRALSYYVFLNFADDRFIERALLDVFRILKKKGRALIGQLPDKNCSTDYEAAKQKHLAYCEEHFDLGKSNRDTFLPPLRLFDKKQLQAFLTAQKISHEFLPSFNPFYREGEPPLVKWRFDLVLNKG